MNPNMQRFFTDADPSTDFTLPILVAENLFANSNYTTNSVDTPDANHARTPTTYDVVKLEAGQYLNTGTTLDFRFAAWGSVESAKWNGFTSVGMEEIAVCIYYRNADSASVTVYADNTSVLNEAITLPDGAGSVMFRYTTNDMTSDALRTTISCSSGNVDIAVLKVGRVVRIPAGFPVGYAPSRLNLQDEYESDFSVNGQLLFSRLVRTGIQEELSFPQIDPQWVRDVLPYLKAMMKLEGVFLAWYPSDYSQDVVYGALSGICRASYDSVNTQAVAFRLAGPEA